MALTAKARDYRTGLVGLLGNSWPTEREREEARRDLANLDAGRCIWCASAPADWDGIGCKPCHLKPFVTRLTPADCNPPR